MRVDVKMCGVFCTLGHSSQLPWLVYGDFNEVLYSFEKKGNLPREERRMEAFQSALNECQLFFVGYSSPWFTLERGNSPKINIRERLDRGVTNNDMLLLFPDLKIQHIPHVHSDHYPLLVTLDEEKATLGMKRFRFEAWWILEDSFEDEVRKVWEST